MLLLFAAASAAPSFNVRDFGAAGDNRTDDTAAFEKALAKAAATTGASQVLVPKGGVYLIRPINLTSDLDFYIEGGAHITGMMDHTAWPIIEPAPSYGQGRDHKGPRYTSLLHGEHLHNVTIRGDGTRSILDGQGWYWWARHKTGKTPSGEPSVEMYTRGHLLEFMFSSSIGVYDLTMKDSPFWTNHFFDCDRVHVRGVAITAQTGLWGAPNTDGWDPDSATNVLIEDSSYQGGDDCVAIKSGWDCFGVAYAKPTRNVTVRNVTCDGRVAGVAIGSEMSGGVEDVTIDRVHFRRANGAAHIKTGQTRGGYVTNVSFRNLTFADGAEMQEGVLVDAHYGDRNPSCPASWKPAAPPRMANYSFINIDGRKTSVSSNPFHFMSVAAAPITGVFIKNVHLPRAKAKGAFKENWECVHVEGSVVEGSTTPWPPCKEMKVIPS